MDYIGILVLFSIFLVYSLIFTTFSVKVNARLKPLLFILYTLFIIGFIIESLFHSIEMDILQMIILLESVLLYYFLNLMIMKYVESYLKHSNIIPLSKLNHRLLYIVIIICFFSLGVTFSLELGTKKFIESQQSGISIMFKRFFLFVIQAIGIFNLDQILRSNISRRELIKCATQLFVVLLMILLSALDIDSRGTIVIYLITISLIVVSRKRVSFYQYLIAAAVVTGVLLFMTSQRVGRNAQKNLNNYEIILEEIILNQNKIGISKTNTIVTNHLGNNENYLYGKTYFDFFIAIIPRALWKNKPENISLGRHVSEKYFDRDLTSRSGGGTPPGYIGEAFINFGWYGVIVQCSLIWFMFYLFHRFLFSFRKHGLLAYILMVNFLVLHIGSNFVASLIANLFFIGAYFIIYNVHNVKYKS